MLYNFETWEKDFFADCPKYLFHWTFVHRVFNCSIEQKVGSRPFCCGVNRHFGINLEKLFEMKDLFPLSTRRFWQTNVWKCCVFGKGGMVANFQLSPEPANDFDEIKALRNEQINKNKIKEQKKRRQHTCPCFWFYWGIKVVKNCKKSVHVKPRDTRNQSAKLFTQSTPSTVLSSSSYVRVSRDQLCEEGTSMLECRLMQNATLSTNKKRCTSPSNRVGPNPKIQIHNHFLSVLAGQDSFLSFQRKKEKNWKFIPPQLRKNLYPNTH